MPMYSISRRWRVRVFSFLLAAFFALGGLCLSLYRTTQYYQRSIANSYLRAFSQVVSSVDRIDSTMQKEVYVVTPAMISYLSAEIQAEAATAQEAISELPYANIELEQTAALLAKIEDYASATARSASANGSLSEDESTTLEALSVAVSQLREYLDELQTQLLAGDLTLSTAKAVEERLSGLTEDGSVLAGSEFEDLESNFPSVPTMTYDGPFSDHLADANPKALEGLEDVTQEQALAAAAQCTGYRESIFTPGSEIDGEIPCYTFSAAVDGGELSVAVTKTGGVVLSINNSRAVSDVSLTQDEGAKAAWDFLTRNGYTGLEETYRYQQSGRLTIHYAYKQDTVLCYPDLVSVTVAMDTGSILSYECTSYLSNHTQRELEEPAVTVDEARELVSDKLDVLREQLAVIPTDGEYEVLCWEFICEADNGQHYILCINAATGAEQKILILLEDENGTLTL